MCRGRAHKEPSFIIRVLLAKVTDWTAGRVNSALIYLLEVSEEEGGQVEVVVRACSRYNVKIHEYLMFGEFHFVWDTNVQNKITIACSQFKAALSSTFTATAPKHIKEVRMMEV